MKPLTWIIAEAKKLKKQYPTRYSKWTDYVKQASAIYSSKHPKSPVAKKKVSAVSGYYGMFSKEGNKKVTELVNYAIKHKLTIPELRKKILILEKTYPEILDTAVREYIYEAVYEKGGVKEYISGTKTHKDTKSHNVNIKVVSGVGALPVGFKGVIWGVPFKIVNQFDIYNNVKLIVEDTQTGSIITIYDGTSDYKINLDQFVNYIISNRTKNYTYSEKDKKELQSRLTKFSKQLQSEVKSYNAGNKKTVKNKTLVISKTTKKQPVTKKVHSKGETVKEIKDILKSDKKRLKGGYTVVPGRVMSGISGMYKDFIDVNKKIAIFEKEIENHKKAIKNKNLQPTVIEQLKKQLISIKKYLSELKKHKQELKRII